MLYLLYSTTHNYFVGSENTCCKGVLFVQSLKAALRS